jgi:hypothetical protein
MSTQSVTDLLERMAEYIDMPTHKYLATGLVDARDRQDWDDLRARLKACDDLERELSQDQQKFEYELDKISNDSDMEFIKHV